MQYSLIRELPGILLQTAFPMNFVEKYWINFRNINVLFFKQNCINFHKLKFINFKLENYKGTKIFKSLYLYILMVLTFNVLNLNHLILGFKNIGNRKSERFLCVYFTKETVSVLQINQRNWTLAPRFNFLIFDAINLWHVKL